MDTSLVLHEIRDTLRQLSDGGQKRVQIDALEKYLKGLEVAASDLSEDQLARYRAQHESNLAEYKAKIESSLEVFRTVHQTGQIALKTAILINGGAAVTLLAFLGSIWNSGAAQALSVARFPESMLAFVLGVFSAALATGTNYLASYTSARATATVFLVVNAVSIALVIGSYTAFIVGGALAYSSFAPL